MLLLVAAVLPGLFWDAAPDTAPALREAGIVRILVPASRADSWKSAEGVTAEPADLQSAVKLPAPGVNYRIDRASASRTPWLVSNGWKFLRQPGARFYYETAGPQSALAAAEAFAYGANGIIKSDSAGLKPLAEMLAFLKSIETENMPAIADFGFIDDGSFVAGEVMNLLVRHNLLFKALRAPDPNLKLNVRLGAKEYPLEQAKDPGAMAQIIRANLTDNRRSLRIYGSAVVVGRLNGSGSRLRLHLINYDGAARAVNGIRVRVLGQYPNHRLAAAGAPGEELQDFSVLSDATEFTLPELKMYAVIDLNR